MENLFKSDTDITISTDLITYLNYVSTWDSQSDENIDKLIDEQKLFVRLGDFSADSAIDDEFNTLVGLAEEVRDTAIAAEAIQIAADAAAVASIGSFIFGMAAFIALEAAKAIDEKFISSKTTELNNKLKTIDTDISAKISDDVNQYIIKYKANNDLIASNPAKGLGTRTCRSLLMQFMAQVQKANNGKLDANRFKLYAESARVLYNSLEITDVYDALDKLNFSAKTDADVQKFLGCLKGLNYPAAQLSIVRNFSIAIIYYKLGIANETIRTNAEAAGFDVAEVESSTFGMLDAVGKFVAVVAVVMSVVDTVLEVIDIVHVVEQSKKMCDELNGSIKSSYKAYFDGMRTASQNYVGAIGKMKIS